MKRKEAALAACIVREWAAGLGAALLARCGVGRRVPPIQAGFRLPATDVAWREFDLITAPFENGVTMSRIIIELKNGGLGYRSLAQVLLYKHVVVPRHRELLEAEHFVFVLLGARPNTRRWSGTGALESDAEAFASLLRAEYWPDPDVHALSYDDLGLHCSSKEDVWSWHAAQQADAADGLRPPLIGISLAGLRSDEMMPPCQWQRE